MIVKKNQLKTKRSMVRGKKCCVEEKGKGEKTRQVSIGT